MLRYLDDPSLNLEPINLYLSFHTIIKLVSERLHAVELWQAYFKCVQVTKIKNKKDLYYVKSAQIKELPNPRHNRVDSIEVETANLSSLHGRIHTYIKGPPPLQ